MPLIDTKILPSFEKCFLDEKLSDKVGISEISMLRNERLSFQLAYVPHEPARIACTLSISGGLEEHIAAYRVDSVPVTLTGAADEDYLRSTPGLYPDLLTPIKLGGSVIATSAGLHSIMLTIEDPNGIAPGVYELTVGLAAGEDISASKLKVTVVDAMLPEQTLIHTQWFHNDCIATHYGCEVFSERHWELIGNYMEAAVRCGVNMILTPVLTPPLDTAVGHERPTVQLVDIKLTEDGYEFGFEKLDRYVKLALDKGIKYFEISHLFSQWGAIHAPKVVASDENGETKRIFGWDTDATGAEYTKFIREFVSALIGELKRLGVDKQCWFHISDEPQISQLESYTAAKNTIADLLEGYHQLDALSNYEFYATGAVETPVPATNHIVPFLEHDVPELWTYYCCGQSVGVSNRFVAMPGQRTRILGEQLYKFDIKGFLQWGFNFWYTCGSLAEVNPYLDLSGDNWVPAGDTFSVYPGVDGKAVYSLHALLFYEALQDMRALQLLEKKLGREAVVALIDFGCSEPMTFTSYPRDKRYLLNLREVVNLMLS